MAIKGYFFFLINFTLLSVVISHPIETDAFEIGEEKDITEINKGLMVDDIVEETTGRSATTSGRLWTSPIAYIMQKDLDVNNKGVILKAIEQFRLKTCIDFKPRDAEEYYLHIQQLNGCFSGIGRRKPKPEGQTLSIGLNCGEVSTVEHEFLHALGFYHEQSRYDRDEYVTIVMENIEPGFENNFKKVDSSKSTTQGIEYDYTSVMHYGQKAFSIGKENTIITKDPAFQNAIGQRLEMSPKDILELNLLYKCNSAITFQMFCGFIDESTCNMTKCSQSELQWEMVTSVSDGPTSDHTNLPSGSGDHGDGAGNFMHVSTASGNEGDSAWLETNRMSPKGKCHVQCLQFYYYHTGNEGDQLNIWIREFDDETDTKGTARVMGQITGPATSQWKLHHVSLNAMKHFQVEFEVLKGTGSSTGGFSIDDINLSDTECPHVTMQIDDLKKRLESEKRGTTLYSPRQYSPDGYAYRVAVRLYRLHFGLFVQLVSGDNDDKLVWPCPYRQVTFKMLDQNPNIQLQMSKQRSITSDPEAVDDDGLYLWDNPRKYGTTFLDENNKEAFAGPLLGKKHFGEKDDLAFQDYAKGSTIFTFSFQDINPLFEETELPCPVVGPVSITHPHNGNDDGPCFTGILPFILPTRTTDDKSTQTSLPPITTTDDKRIHTSLLPIATTDDKRIRTSIPFIATTGDKSIFGLSPRMVASPVLIFLLALILVH
uniref:Metalloendopeptidase n=1 Tax=Gouania willdenowi TaxID=441366 RepID=A0A8C5DZR3_GOUWI